MSKKKKEEIDKETTVANMNVDGFRWYKSPHEKKRKSEISDLQLTRKEKHALIRAAFISWLPTILSIAFGFTIAALLCFWWLS